MNPPTEDICLAARWMANHVCLPSPVVGMMHTACAPFGEETVLEDLCYLP